MVISNLLILILFIFYLITRLSFIYKDKKKNYVYIIYSYTILTSFKRSSMYLTMQSINIDHSLSSCFFWESYLV